jgi:hypothetical protein
MSVVCFWSEVVGVGVVLVVVVEHVVVLCY